MGPTTSSYTGAVTVHVYHLGDGFKRTVSVNAQAGTLSIISLFDAAGLSGVDTDVTLRRGRGILGTTKFADYSSSQTASVSDGSG